MILVRTARRTSMPSAPWRLPAAATVVCTSMFGSASLAQRIENPNVVIIRGDVAQPGLMPGRLPVVDDPEAAARLQEIVSALGSSDYRVREQASMNLTNDPAISLSMIEQVVRERGDALGLEARQRLMAAARDRFWRTPRGALGIQFWNNLRDRVVIERTFRGFEAADLLEDGDMIIEADGRKIEGYMARNRLQSIIVSHEPNEVIQLVVRRGERIVRLNVHLGKRDDLENSTLTEDILVRSWQVRSEAYWPAGIEPINPGVSLADWQVTSKSQERANRLAFRAKGVDVAGPNVAGGGMPRGAAIPVDQLNIRMANALRNNNRAQAMLWQQGGLGGWDPNVEPNVPPETRRAELQQMLQAKVKIAAELKTWEPDPSRPIDEQLMVERSYQERLKMLEMFDKQIRAIKAEMTEHAESFDEIEASVNVVVPTDEEKPDEKEFKQP